MANRLQRVHTTLPDYIFALSLFLSMFRFAPATTTTGIDYQTTLPGTTRGIEYIFKGRCYYYLTTYKNLGLNPEGAEENADTFCAETWATFKSAFAGKDICSVTQDAYKPFFDKTAASIPIENKVRDVNEQNRKFYSALLK